MLAKGDREAGRTDAVLLRPVYPLGPVAPIELYSGSISVDSSDPLPGRIVADLAAIFRLRWSVTGAIWPFQPGQVNLGIDPPDFGSTTVPALLNRALGVGLIMNATCGDPDAECDHVVAHFTNLPMIYPAGSGRWRGTGTGWELILESRSDHAEVLDELPGSVFFVVTHLGRLRRVDRSSFKASEAVALEARQVALSFALSRWIAPVAPVGFDVDGKCVWEQWGSWRCSPAYRVLRSFYRALGWRELPSGDDAWTGFLLGGVCWRFSLCPT